MRSILLSCMLAGVALAEPAIPKSIELPKVAAAGYGAYDEAVPTIVVSKSQIVVEGKAIVSVVNGDVEPADKEGGVLGIKIPRLTQFVATLQTAFKQRGKPIATMSIVADKTTPAKLLVEVIYSTKQAGVAAFQLAADAAGKVVAAPITLAEKQKPAGLGLVVSVTRTDLLVWSLSGREGTLKQPKTKIAISSKTLTADASKALAGIAKRNPTEKLVNLQPDGAIPMEIFADLLGAAHASFPEVHLASGFE